MQKLREFKMQVITKEPFRIGGKKDPLSGADNPVTKIGGRLAIPGSSLKGALRNELERFLIDTYHKDGKWAEGHEHFQPCIPGAQFSADEKRLIKIGKYRNQSRTCHYPCDRRNCRNL